MRLFGVGLIVVTAACVQAGQPRSPVPYGTYRFSGTIPGLEDVRGSFAVNAAGNIASFSGTCRPADSPNPGATNGDCRIQRLSIAGDNDSIVTVAVKVLVSETTPWPGDPTRSQVRYAPYSGHLTAARGGR